MLKQRKNGLLIQYPVETPSDLKVLVDAIG
jgi:hypothetical protein